MSIHFTMSISGEICRTLSNKPFTIKDLVSGGYVTKNQLDHPLRLEIDHISSPVLKTIINHPFGNGLYHLIIVICGMVYFCFNHINTYVYHFYLLQCICFNESMNLIMGLCFHCLIVSFFDFPVYGLSIEKQKEFSVFAPIPNISYEHVSKIGTPCQYT